MTEQFLRRFKAHITGSLLSKIFFLETITNFRFIDDPLHEPLPQGIEGVGRPVIIHVTIAGPSAKYPGNNILRSCLNGCIDSLSQFVRPNDNQFLASLRGHDGNTVFV